jgi:glycosyltransferase involved in cell wall biosynthesis
MAGDSRSLAADPRVTAHLDRAAIDRLLADDAERDRLGRAGLNRATSLFTWEKTAKALRSAYEEAMA